MVHYFPAGSVVSNKYLTWYLLLCSRNRDTGYVEKHHIVPSSFGGGNHKKNIVCLSAREHYVAHVMLIRCSLGIFRRKAALAAHYMLTECAKHQRAYISKSRNYEFIRREFALAQANRTVTQSTRDKIGAAHRGKTLSAEAKKKMGLSLRHEHTFYMMHEQDYKSEKDFYRFCTEHKIGRSQVQAGLKNSDIHVVLAGKHKGTCFSWNDVGITAMHDAREQALKQTAEKRKQSIALQWKTKPKTSTRNVSVVLRDPEGNEHYFINMLAAEASTGIPWTTIQSCKRIPWTLTRGKGAGWTITSRNKS